MKDLNEIRKQINDIDKRLAELFEQRMECAKEVGEFKKEKGLPILDEQRESEIIKHNLEYISNEELKPYYVNFIKELMNESKHLQQKITSGLRVGYSGVPGAFAYIAATRMYPNSIYVSFPSFEKAYKGCQNGEVDTVILPIENSYAGDVGGVLDLIFQGDLKINQMYDLEITHNMLGVKGSKLSDIKTMISHVQALNQCDEYIKEHNFEVVEATNTAIAATIIKEKNDKSLGAIASKETAEIYDLEILDKHINSANTNSTRFASFSRVDRTVDPTNKMGEHFILVFTVINEAGALAKALNIIGSNGFNMRNLRSRPMKELLWNYYFFVEVEGNINTEEGRDTLIQLKTVCDRLKLVGTYYDFKQK